MKILPWYGQDGQIGYTARTREANGLSKGSPTIQLEIFKGRFFSLMPKIERYVSRFKFITLSPKHSGNGNEWIVRLPRVTPLYKIP